MKTTLYYYMCAVLVTTTTTAQITFTPAFIDNSETTANAANSVTAADFNNDGNIDVAGAAFQSDIFSVYLNDGTGNFTQQTIDIDPVTANGARFVLSKDLDQDGDQDILATSSTADHYLWYENDGNAAFTKHVIDNSSLANEAYGIDAADFNQDGHLDIVGGANSGDALAIFSNDGSQNFLLFSDLSTGNAFTDGVRAVKAVDLDQDGDPDILVAANSGDTYSWFENDGSGVFTPHVIDNSTNANGASQIQAADLDGDGDLDVLGASNLGDVFLWFENDGSQNFTSHIIDNSMFANGPRGLAVVDLEQDGDIDVLTATISGDVFAWYENDGAGNFTPALISNDQNHTSGAFAITAADIDNDLVDDIIVAANVADAFSWFKTEGVVILGTDESNVGQFQLYPNPASEVIQFTLPNGVLISEITITDVSGKRIMDVSEAAINNQSIKTNKLSNGLYLISFVTDKGTVSKRFIKK